MTAARLQRSKKPNRSKTSRAGLTFPVGRMLRELKQKYFRKMFRVSAGAGVYVSAVIEYLMAEMAELAGNHTKLSKKKRIQPRQVMMAIATDQELHTFLRHVIIPGGGVMPCIHKSLVPAHSPTPAVRKVGAKPTVTRKRKPAAGKAIPVARPVSAAAAPAAKPKPGAPPRRVSVKAGEIVILGEKALHLGQKLTVIKSDITKVAVDAVVHPTNSSLFTGGLIGQSLAQRGGAEYIAEINKAKTSGDLAKDAVLVTPAFNINARHVIHCNGPMWSDANNVTRLGTTVRNILSVADEKNMLSIAIPSIGSGKAGWPKQTAAETILRSIHGYFAASAQSSIRQIYFVLFDKESIDTYIGELNKLVV